MNTITETAIESIYLYPSTLVVHNENVMVNTILGSCVAVCLYDSTKKIGGINHYMLPLWNGEGLSTPKYGNIAIDKLIEKMITAGCRKENLLAKVFGGGEVLELSNNSFQIGKRNIEIAFQILNNHNIPIVAQSTGGYLGRKIIFHTHTGEVAQRFVKSYKNK